MIKKFLAVFLLNFLLLPAISSACGNEYFQEYAQVPMRSGRLDVNSMMMSGNPYFNQGFERSLPLAYVTLHQRLTQAGGFPENTPLRDFFGDGRVRKVDYRLISDAALMALKMGKKKEALEVLQQLYSSHPKEYNIVVNLGTAYEVNGDNQNALKYIREAVELNPHSHHGSEWIHIRILEQKISGDSPGGILNINRGIMTNGILPATSSLPSIHADSLLIQLAYQLHERIGFTPPPDTVVGQLVHDFAVLVVHRYDSAQAQQFFRLAEEYLPQATFMPDSEAQLKSGTLNNTPFWNSKTSLLAGVGLVVVVASIIFAIRHRRSTRSKAG